MSQLNEIEMRKKYIQELEIKAKARETNPNTFRWKATVFSCINCATKTIFTFVEFDNVEQEEVYDYEVGHTFICSHCSTVFHRPDVETRDDVKKSLKEFCTKL